MGINTDDMKEMEQMLSGSPRRTTM
jgi:hypothetical protein